MRLSLILLFCLFFSLIFSPLVSAVTTGRIDIGEPTRISFEGECRNFDVFLDSVLTDCWDVKLDVPGEVLNQGKWTDTFYYVPNALCDGEASLKLRLYSSEDFVNGTLKLRQNNTIREEAFIIEQNCPAGLQEGEILIVVAIIIIIFFALILWYRKM